MTHFTTDNTEGYTEDQLDELNSMMSNRIGSLDICFTTKDGILLSLTEALGEDEYKTMRELVELDYEKVCNHA